MNKKTWLILGGVAVVGIIVFFVYSFMNPKDLAGNIPKDAVFATRIDLASMGKKIKFDELSEFKMFKYLKKEMSSKAKEQLEKIMKDPTESGLNLLQAPYIFALNSEEKYSNVTVGMIAGISSKEKFIKLVKTMDESGDLEISNEKNYTVISMSKREQIYLNDKILLMLSGRNSEKNPNSDLANKIFKITKEQSLLSNKEFAELRNHDGDVSLFINKKQYIEMLSDMGGMGALGMMGDMDEMMKSYPVGMTLNFDNDAVRMKMISDPSQKNVDNPYYNNTGLSDADLKMIDPDGTPIMYASVNMNFKKIFEIFSKNTMMDGGLSQVTSMLGITKDDIGSLLKGNMSIALNDIQMNRVVSEWDTSYSYNEPKAYFTFHAGIGNENAYDAIMSKASVMLGNDNGVYAFEISSYSHDSIYFAKSGKDFFLSNNKTYVTDFNSGAKWKTLTADCQQETAAKNPIAMFVDLRYEAYSKLIEEDGGAMAASMAKSIMSNLKYMRAFANAKDGLFELQMSEKNINSLWRMLLMAEDAFKMAKVADL